MRKTFAEDALLGRKAMVMAASRGIGKAVAEQLAAMGADLVIMARSQDELQEVARQIESQTGRSVTVEVVDLLEQDTLRQVIENHQDTDILVTNCGGPPVAPFATLPLKAWDEGYHMIVRSVVIACQILVPNMAARGWGRVVMLTSSTVFNPLFNFAISNALRKSLLGVAQSIAQEYASQGVSANLVCQGLTKTKRLQSLIQTAMTNSGDDEVTVLKRMVAPLATRRLAEPQEIAALVAFLCSEQASFIQGQALLIDGGQALSH